MSLSYSPSISTNGLVFNLDAGNRKCYNPNLLTNTDYSTAGYTQNLTLTAGFGDPFGGSLASKTVATTADPYMGWGFNVKPSQTYTASVWVRGEGVSVGKYFTFAMWDGAAWLSGSWTYQVLTTSWQRVYFTFTTTSGATQVGGPQLRYDIPESPGAIGDTVFVYGAMLTEGPNLIPYVDQGATVTASSVLDNIGNQTGSFIANTSFDANTTASSFQFDNTGEYISLATTVPTFGLGTFSIECWFYPTSSVTTNLIYSNQSSNVGGVVAIGFTTGSFISTFDGTNRSTTIHQTTVSLNTWHHIVGIRNGLNQLWVYQDGVLSSSSSSSVSNISANADPRIGCNPASTTEKLVGKVAILRMYNREISATEVKQNYIALRGRFGV